MTVFPGPARRFNAAGKDMDAPAVKRVVLPMPPMGGKCWVLKEKGIFVLEAGPGTLRTIACTHAGAGGFEAIDGVPSEDGFFPDEEMTEPAAPAGYIDRLLAGEPGPDDAAYQDRNRAYGERNGRTFYRANPAVMGSWMLDAGFIHGLTLRVIGGHESAAAMASIVWVPFKTRTIASAPIPGVAKNDGGEH